MVAVVVVDAVAVVVAAVVFEVGEAMCCTVIENYFLVHRRFQTCPVGFVIAAVIFYCNAQIFYSLPFKLL